MYSCWCTLHSMLYCITVWRADLLRLQDANECWTEIMRMMSEYLPGEGSTSTETVRKSFIEQYFGGENVTTLKCSESEEEPEAKSVEKWTQLRCHINTDVRYMQLGLTMVSSQQNYYNRD